MKNLATRIMSNGVEVLVKDKNGDSGKNEQRRIKLLHITLKPTLHLSPSSMPKQSLLSSTVSTVVNHQQMSGLFPLHQLMHHNYIIKTCLTTFTYLTTIVQNKRSAISTFETIVSVVTTESLTNLYATDLIADIKPTKTKFMEVKTIQPSVVNNIYQSNLPKIDKRVDDESGGNEQLNFDLIQPSEPGHASCTTSCSCSHTKTEGLKTIQNSDVNTFKKLPLKTSKYGATKVELRPTGIDKKTQYGPYEYESSSQSAPTDKIVEKYTEVINDYSDEKESGSVEESELLTNEQAPSPPKTNKVNNKNVVKIKPEKPQKPSQTKPNNKNKFVVADLLKLGSLGIKGLSQLAPVIEKMTGGFMKRQDVNKTTSTTTVKPVTKITPYQVNKRIDSDIESNQSNFPIYIPVDEMETSESQVVFTNATLHQNLAWAAEHKQSKGHMTKMVHESPLVNGGIPISPGEIITANSDVIVGKPAVGGPLTLAASGIRLQNPVNPPPLDSFVSSNEHFIAKERPDDQSALVDDSFDLRPPELPKTKPIRNMLRPSNLLPKHHEENNNGFQHQHNYVPNKTPSRPFLLSHPNENIMKTEQIPTAILSNHGRPAFLDFIPSLANPDSNTMSLQQNVDFRPFRENKEEPDVSDNSPSSSELVDTRVQINGEFVSSNQQIHDKPFLVDIQPSKVANVIIPHGSSTALVFTGSSEPHKTGDYIDDPLPYPEPGYFGSFSIDAPQMTNVHNLPPSKSLQVKPNNQHAIESHGHNNQEHGFRNEIKAKRPDNKRPMDLSNLPPPTSKQESHFQYGPQITVYNPEVYKPSGNGKFEKYNQKYNKDGKEIIDKDYENYLAVPPPPPPKKPFNGDRPYNQKPIVHTKPVQDMKVFLNIQHPVPKQQNHQVKPQNQDVPLKVTSEIYFAAQNPQNTQTPTYTVHIPNGQNMRQNNYYSQVHNVKPQTNNGANQYQNQYVRPEHDSFMVVSSPMNNAKPGIVSDVNVNQNTYTVTLNTATNVANNVGDTDHIVGSNVPVSIGSNSLNGDIPIGTNFAIRVEGGPSQYNYDMPLQGNKNPPVFYNEHGQGQSSIEIAIGDNRWNTTDLRDEIKIETNTIVSSTPEYVQNNIPFNKQNNIDSSILPSVNSHANFPMMNKYSNVGNENVKLVTEIIEDTKPGQKRPAKLIPNIATNSHGWYSSVPVNELNTINNIKVEATTRKAIPLLFEYNHHSLPNFGQKITSAGKPPSEFFAPNSPSTQIDANQHYDKQQENQTPSDKNVQSTSKPFLPNYIPHNFGVIRQPVYDIPVRDNSDETTTTKVSPANDKRKQVYEDSHAIYDGEEELDNNEADGEVSQESVKVPVVTSSEEADNKREESKTSTEITLLQDEVVSEQTNKEKQKEANVQFIDFNPGTQTEKPFDVESYNKSYNFQTNSIKPIYENNPLNKPRPFTMNTATTLDHQLQQPHWQINQMVENATNISVEENIDLNIGEEMNSKNTQKPSTQRIPYRHQNFENKYKRPQRPIFSLRGNDSNIITSTVHIQDKKPLTVIDDSNEDSSTLTSITTSHFDLNRSSSEIIDLSPPPPTMDYSFKPSTADEMIMGMSPPPPNNSIPPKRPLPTRSPITPRPLPVRTPPPYRTNKPRTTRPTQRPTRKPVTRDEVSTYRPHYDTIINDRRPILEHDEPSSQLLPPPKETPSIIIPINEKPSIATSVPNLVFPTPISSGWLTSSGVGFSSSFGFEPTSIHSPASEMSKMPEQSSTDKSFAYYYETELSSTERIDDGSSEKPMSNEETVSKDTSTESSNKSKMPSEETNVSDSAHIETSQEESSIDKKVIPLRNKNNLYPARPNTRKPYPGYDEDKKSSVIKYKSPPSRPVPNIKPTRTIRPEIYPTRQTSIRKIVRPLPTRPSTIVRPSVIESSESFIDDGDIKPSEVHKENELLPQSEKPSSSHKTPYLESSVVHDSESAVVPLVKPTHHAGNEVKVSDEIIPTKTEFRTTVITLTKTLSEPPKIVSSIGYVNLTHTLTVTHTMTSLISQSEGAKTQTLVLTNTHTSTIVDVVTEIHTQVQPTTIIETVTKHIPIPQIEPTPVNDVATKTKIALDDLTMSSEERENFIIHDSETTENIQKIEQENENDNDTFFVVINKSQNGGPMPPLNTDIETGDYDGITRNEQVNSNGVSQVLFGEILLAGTPYLETSNVVNPAAGAGYGKECQPDCKASRNERCQRIDGIMKCVCRPGFARMFPDRPCKPTYTYSVKLALSSQGNEHLKFHSNLADNSSDQYHSLALATHEGINRMVMQSDLRDVYHGVHINGFHPVDIKKDDGEAYQGVMNDFYVQLSDNAHESRLKEVIEKYLRTNNYSLGGTEVFAASELMDRLNVSDFDECVSGQFHDCSEHAQCFNLRGTYTCSCLEGFADLSVNPLYPGRICSAEPVGCERCNYHGACYSRDDRRVLCECFQWYSGSTCHINLKVVLISLVTVGALLTVVLVICAVVACSKRPRPPPRSIVTCIQAMPSLHQGVQPSKQRADRRALITERGDSGESSSIQNASLPYMPTKKQSSSSKKMVISEPPAHEAPPPPAPAVMIPRAKLHPPHRDSREMASRKQSLELSSEAKLISYLESGANVSNDEMMRRKHSMESSYSAPKDRTHHGNKQGALVSAGFKVSTTIRPDDPMMMKDDRDDLSSVNKNDLEAELHFDSLRKSYSQEDISEWTDAERRIGELTLSEARSVGGTLPASTGRAASSTRLTHQEANTMAERDLGSTFLLPHVHLYKPDITSDVSEFDSL